MNTKNFPMKMVVMCMICIIIICSGCVQDPEISPHPNLQSIENENPSNMEEQAMLSNNFKKLTDAEKASLWFMAEEEKLAGDVYNYMFELYGMQIFQNIYFSEIDHVNAVAHLLEKRGLWNPNDAHGPGVFFNEELQLLYNNLILQGSLSASEAIAVGVIIEETDLEDIQYYLDYVAESKDIVKVYENLLAGSESHLAAFLSQQE